MKQLILLLLVSSTLFAEPLTQDDISNLKKRKKSKNISCMKLT